MPPTLWHVGYRLKDREKDHYNVGVNCPDKDSFCTLLQSVAYVDNDASVSLFMVALTHYIFRTMGYNRGSWDTIKSQSIID